ncbi:MAG: hypothetical protein ACP5F3_04655 [Candidatus Syntrophosphaera sp.]
MNGLRFPLLCLAFLVALPGLQAQTPEWLWAVGFGDENGYDGAQAIVMDNQGNQYVTGSFLGTVQFGDPPSPVPAIRTSLSPSWVPPETGSMPGGRAEAAGIWGWR